MKSIDPPFYPGETVVGRVVSLGPRFATIDIGGWQVPLETAFIDWNAYRTPGEVLSLGDRLNAVIHDDGRLDSLYRRHGLRPKQIWDGFWLSRLPLLEDPWPALALKYPDGSVVEVEMIDYVNWYIARVRMPEGLVIELRTGDIHLKTKRSSNFLRKLHQGERFKVVFRRLYRPGGWVQRFVGGSTADCLSESGFVTPLLAAQSLTRVEQAFMRHREQIDSMS
ncbi:hypothetical protein [Propionivibrio sp.]|uniref:hypothetical protein n=1 Tax=Propionivibrio sp. TaxID=2212460 RepID=UPI003BF37DB1